MNAKIKSMYLMSNNNNLYWKLTLIDEQGDVIGTFGDEFFSDDINFRKQTFYIMKILNNWDLLKMDGMNKSFPVLVDVDDGMKNYISNYNGDYLKIDYETGEVLSGTGCNISNFFPREISKLRSTSGVFVASVTDKYSHCGVLGNLVYLGFTPIYPNQKGEEVEIRGARCFKEFIGGFLGLCNIRELIQTNNYPEVLVKFDSNDNIIAIGDVDGTEYLYITENGYVLEEGKQKTL